MTLSDFKHYVETGIVKKQTPNPERALSLIKESSAKKQYLSVSIKNIPKGEMSPNFIVDYCYDMLIELIRAKMLIDGYNSGKSHEAEVSYMRVIGFSEADTRFMDEVRYFRNGTKYYGTLLNNEYAGKVLEFSDKLYPLLKKILNEK